MSDPVIDRRQFLELLPFYINGSLEEPVRRQVDDYLSQTPDARVDLALSAALSSAACAPLNERDPMAGYDILQKRLGSQESPSLRPRNKKNANAGWWNSLLQFFSGLGLSPAMAVVLLMLSAQIAVTSSFNKDQSTSAEYRGGPQTTRRADLKLVLRSKAVFEDVVLLLSQNQCKIVWGPSTTGELWLAVDVPGSVAAVQARLASSPLVEDVQLTPNESSR